jgi:hypothetical protein
MLNSFLPSRRVHRCAKCANDTPPRQFDLERVITVGSCIVQLGIARSSKGRLLWLFADQHSFGFFGSPRLMSYAAERNTRMPHDAIVDIQKRRD